MDGRELYLLGCRFPDTVIPQGLVPECPRVEWEEKLGWVAQYWYYTKNSPIPRMYVKLRLDNGSPLIIEKMTEEMSFPPDTPTKIFSQQEKVAYLELCAKTISSSEPSKDLENDLFHSWRKILSEAQILWITICYGDHGKKKSQVQTAPPIELAEYWTFERIEKLWTEEKSAQAQTEWKIPTEKGCELWRNYKNLSAAKACIPGELMASIPRLFYSDTLGWVAEYWYYDIGDEWYYPRFDPEYSLRVCLDSGQLLEMKKWTDRTKFQQAKLSVMVLSLVCDLFPKPLHYLACCEELLEKSPPSPEEIERMQGMWLGAHSSQKAVWLLHHSGVSEEAVRWELSPNGIGDRDLILPALVSELKKGVKLGSPAVAEICIERLLALQACMKKHK